ncbi:MAG: hypothetical protein AAFV77_02105 [Planctomycetota bacterium]
MSMDPQQVIEHISQEIDRRWQMEREAVEENRRRAHIDAQDMLAHASREVDRLWSLEAATRKASDRHRKVWAVGGGLIGALPLVTAVIGVAIWFHGTIETNAVTAAVNTVKNDTEEIKEEYTLLREASVDLIKGVSQDAADVSQQLGAARQELAAANERELDEVAAALEAELKESRSQIIARITQAQEDLSAIERRLQDLDEDLNLAQAEKDVEQISLLLETVRGNEGLEEWDSLRRTVTAHEGMLSGDQAISKLKVQDVVFETLTGQRDLDLANSWFFGVDFYRTGVARTRLRGPDKTILQHRVVDGRDPSLEVLRLGQGSYEPYQFPPAR